MSLLITFMYMSTNTGTIQIVSEIFQVFKDNVDCFENIHVREKERDPFQLHILKISLLI